MKPLAFVIALAAVAVPAGASAGPRSEKVYAPNGRRVAVIKHSSFGQRIYGENGRRIAVVRSR